MTVVKIPAWYESRLRLIGWGSALALLSLPAVAMQAGAEGVAWSASDFLVFGALLLTLGLGLELAMGRSADRTYRLAATIALFGNALLLWVNLAVGIFGPETEAPNVLFLTVPMIGIVGALASRGRASGMAKVMGLSVFAQLALGLAGLILASGRAGSDFTPLGLLTLVMAAGWAMSAFLFAKAARP